MSRAVKFHDNVLAHDTNKMKPAKSSSDDFTSTLYQRHLRVKSCPRLAVNIIMPSLPQSLRLFAGHYYTDVIGICFIRRVVAREIIFTDAKPYRFHLFVVLTQAISAASAGGFAPDIVAVRSPLGDAASSILLAFIARQVTVSR